VYIWTLVAPLIRSTWGHYLGLDLEPVRLPSARRASAAQLRDDFKRARKILKKAEATVDRSKPRQQLEQETNMRKRHLKETPKNPREDENADAGSSESSAKAVDQKRTEPEKFSHNSQKQTETNKRDGRKDKQSTSSSSVDTCAPTIATNNQEGSYSSDRASEEHVKLPDPSLPIRIQIDHPFEKITQESVFNNSVKEPDVSKEILRLQERILRFQAKIVKIQYKILSIQETGEVTIPRTETRTKRG